MAICPAFPSIPALYRPALDKDTGHTKPSRVAGAFPAANAALMLACARLRHVAGTQWKNKKYMNIKYLEAATLATSIFTDFIHLRACNLKCEKWLTLALQHFPSALLTAKRLGHENIETTLQTYSRNYSHSLLPEVF